MSSLRIDWITRQDAERAVMRWHYSRRMPRFKLACLGVWEDGKWIGAVIFGCGATPEIGRPFGVAQHEACELVRVALARHTAPVSRILAISLRMIRKAYPKLRVCVSFADGEQGHCGGIYQAGGWTYVGPTYQEYIKLRGVIEHPKTLHSRYGVGGQSMPWLRANVDPTACRVRGEAKHKYVWVFDTTLKSKLKSLPYPKRAVSTVASAPSVQDGEGGSKPTTALL